MCPGVNLLGSVNFDFAGKPTLLSRQAVAVSCSCGTEHGGHEVLSDLLILSS